MLTAVPPNAKGPETPAEAASRDLLLWQLRLLPFMTYSLVVMAAVFFFFSGLHVYQVTRFIQAQDGPPIRSLVLNEISRPTGEASTPQEVMQHSLLLLEADALDKRYHQAGGLLMARIWSRQLAFITGMIMAFVGAVFILGKLSEGVSELSGGTADWKLAISSASPGILLTFFGTVLLVCSLFTHATLDVSDGPAYINTVHWTAPASVPTTAAPDKTQTVVPLDLNEFEKLSQPGKTPGPRTSKPAR